MAFCVIMISTKKPFNTRVSGPWRIITQSLVKITALIPKHLFDQLVGQKLQFFNRLKGALITGMSYDSIVYNYTLLNEYLHKIIFYKKKCRTARKICYFKKCANLLIT